MRESVIEKASSPYLKSDRCINCRTEFSGGHLMALIKWSTKFSFGTETLDHRHKALIRFENRFHAT